MKTNYKMILVLLTMLVTTLAIPAYSTAAENKDENIWAEDKPVMGPPFKLSDERIQEMLNRLGESDPNKAKELTQLRKDDPNKFESEFRKVMHKQFGSKNRERRGKPEGGQRGFAPPEGPCMGPNGPNRLPQEPFMRGGGNEREMWMARMQEEFVEWLKKDYPDEAAKLTKLKGENPVLYMRQLALNMKKYKRIKEASQENPELAEVLKQNLELNQKCGQLLKEIKAAKNDNDKKALTAELEKVLGSKFDLIVKRKQMEYESLRKRLEALKTEVQKSQTNVEKWKSAEFKNDSVKSRLEELLNKQDKFEWD